MMVEQEYEDIKGEEEEEYYGPRSPIVLLPRALLWFPITLLCILGVLYPFYRTGVLQHVFASTQPARVGAIGTSKDTYIALATSDALAVGISPTLFVRQINKESGFNPQASSPAGAEGIAQLMPDTASNLGINPWDPTASLNAAAHLMAGYSHTYNGDYAKALAAYNGGPGTVQNAVNTCGEVAWIQCLPGETQNYIQAIMNT